METPAPLPGSPRVVVDARGTRLRLHAIERRSSRRLHDRAANRPEDAANGLPPGSQLDREGDAPEDGPHGQQQREDAIAGARNEEGEEQAGQQEDER